MRHLSALVLVLTARTPSAAFQSLPQCAGLALRVESKNVQLDSKRFFWGQSLRISVTSGEHRNFTWEVDGPAIQDFDERVSDWVTPGQGWITVPWPPPPGTDALSLYFVPRGVESKETRRIRIRAQAKVSQAWCQQSLGSFSIEPHPKRTELYTADHRRPNQIDGKGRVIDMHLPWHFFHMFTAQGLNYHPSFLHWHHLYVDRYKQWRRQFGYKDLQPWPGKVPVRKNDLFLEAPLNSSGLPAWPTPLANTFERLESQLLEFHDSMHTVLQSCRGVFGCFSGLSSPKSELFWRFHLALDQVYLSYCPVPGAKTRPTDCPITGYK